MSGKWTESQTLRFVELYKRCECLWNFKLNVYKDKEKRSDALEFLKNEMGMENLDHEIIKRKIKAIRDTYASERTKVENSLKPGMLPGNMYKPRLLWYDLAKSFLNNKVGKKYTNSAQPKQKDPLACDAETVFSVEHITPLKIKKTTNLMPPSPPRSSPHYEDSPCKSSDNNLSQQKTPSQNDQFHFFGLYAAQQLRELPFSRAIRLKCKIQQLISEEQLQCDM